MEKRKVVFTNFFDTIARRAIKHDNIEGKQELKRVQDFLNDFLDKNNYMFILTLLDHTSLEDFLIIFNKIAQGIEEEKIKNLSFHITGLSDTYKLIETHKLPDSNVVVNQYHSNKQTVTTSLIKNLSIGMQDHIVAAGSSLHDINMLLNLHDIGGTSYFMDKHYLPFCDSLDIDSMITRIASHPVSKEKFLVIYNDLTRQYQNKVITKEEIQKMYVTCKISDICNSFINRDPIKLQQQLEKKLILTRDYQDIINGIKQ